MRYKYVGHQELVLPGYLSAAGTLVLQPGDVVDFPDELDHPLLQPSRAKADFAVAAADDTFSVDDPADADPAPAAEAPKE